MKANNQIALGSCPTCKGPAQFIDGGQVRHVDLRMASRGGALTFTAFRQANVTRCLKWHPAGIESWSPSDWMTALTGELGELASLLKMRNRERDGLPGNKFSPTQKQLADEIADVVTYLDLLAHVLGVDLGEAAARKFNEVSERVGFPDRIDPGPDSPRLGTSADAELTLTGKELQDAIDFIAPDRTPEQLEESVRIVFGEGHSGKGHYCSDAEYPEEGSILLDRCDGKAG